MISSKWFKSFDRSFSNSYRRFVKLSLVLLILLGTEHKTNAATITVPAGGNFQAAINQAQGGDILQSVAIFETTQVAEVISHLIWLAVHLLVGLILVMIFRGAYLLERCIKSWCARIDLKLSQWERRTRPPHCTVCQTVLAHGDMVDCYRMSGKVLSLEELLRERTRLRARGKSLVFTNGVFDLLHVGHVRYLAEARELGDALVVAINSDCSVQELKGDNRPIINQHERAEILAALRQVSYVSIFDDVSPRSLIAKLLPDILVKGGDYGADEIHGRQEVEAAGGKVIALPFVEGVSTTAIIERMKKSRDR